MEKRVFFPKRHTDNDIYVGTWKVTASSPKEAVEKVSGDRVIRTAYIEPHVVYFTEDGESWIAFEL